MNQSEQTISPENNLRFPPKFKALFRPFRYKVFHGGRGGGKSFNIARALILKADSEKHRILCCREYQNSIRDSSWRMLSDQIEMLGLSAYFEITAAEIRSLRTNSLIIFKGLRHNAPEIRSCEGITICWIEEASLVSKESYEMLIPTIRSDSSEIWISFNPVEETDPTYHRFVIAPPPGAYVAQVNFNDNPWFPKVLEDERLYCLRVAPEEYDHIWLGACRTISDAVIFRGRWAVEAFEPPSWPNEVRFYFGLDFGFSVDPSAFVKCYTTGQPPEEELWVLDEAYGMDVEVDHLPRFLDQIEGARSWPILADGSRPETISYLSRMGFRIAAAEKYPNCVEDRIQHLKGFSKIHVHERCKRLQQELRLYSFKVDRITQEVLPIIVSKHDHLIDALGYSLSGFIKRRGGLWIWARLGE